MADEEEMLIAQDFVSLASESGTSGGGASGGGVSNAGKSKGLNSESGMSGGAAPGGRASGCVAPSDGEASKGAIPQRKRARKNGDVDAALGDASASSAISTGVAPVKGATRGGRHRSQLWLTKFAGSAIECEESHSPITCRSGWVRS